MKTLIFPTILIILDLSASIVYLSDGDYKKFIYWVACGVLTACVTYWKRYKMREDCFALQIDKKPNEPCGILNFNAGIVKQMDCDNCHFYKTKKQYKEDYKKGLER